MRRAFWFLVFAALFCAGCGGEVQDPDAFVVGLEGSPTNLDPRYATDAYSHRIRPLLFDSLIDVEPDGTFTGRLATSWRTEDGLTYVFTLREGVRFHDGTRLTSRDVKYTFDFLRDSANKCPAASSLAPIVSVEAPDDLTVVFRLREVFVPILFKLVKGIVPAHLGDREDFASVLIGSGPYRMVSLARGERLALEANSDYHAGAPLIRKLRFEVTRNDTTRMLRLQNGDLQLVQNAVPPYAVKFLDEDPGLQVMRAPGINYAYLGFNLKDPRGITDKVKVRRALACAVDRDRIVRALLKGQARTATGLLAPSNWAYCPDVRLYPFDVARAKRLLDEAGFPDGDGDGPGTRFTLSYKTSTNKLRNRIAEVMAVQLAQVGVGLEKRSYEWGTFFEDIKKGNFQTYTLSWVGVTDPDIFHYIFHTENQPPRGANRGRYENPVMDRLLEQSRREIDPVARKELFGRIQQILAEDCVYVSLWWADNVVVADRGLSGFRIYPGGEYISLATATWDRGDAGFGQAAQ